MPHPPRVPDPTPPAEGGHGTETALRLSALAGAAALLGVAAARRSRLAMGGATAAALPLLVRGATGHWPGERATDPARPIELFTTISIRRSREEIYDAWRDLARLPAILRHVERVEVLDERRSRWVARTPLGQEVEWEAEITEDEPGRLLAWQSLPGSEVEQRGRLELHDGAPGHGTVLRVDLSLRAPAGRIGRAAAALLAPATEREVHEDLRRFKNVMEAGEVPTNEPQPHGERAAIDPRNPF